MEKSPIVELAKKICPAVVTIVVSKDLPKIGGYYFLPFGDKNFVVPEIQKGKSEKKKIGGGSGFIVSDNGYVLTCQHVVSDKDAEYSVVLEPTKTCPAKVISRDPINDVAILKVRGGSFPCLELGDSEEIKLGEPVIAVGNALGEFQDTISAGIVSGLSRFITAYQAQGQAARLKGLIQTDAAINPGNSGGPLINMEGKVIGINTAMALGAQNIGFAIPINYAKKDLEQVKKYGEMKMPFLGVRYIILNKDISKVHKLPVDYGAMIVRERLGEKPIIKGSAADKAGLKEYDIILDINGEKITAENSLDRILSGHKIGEEIEINVLRQGKKFVLRARLGERK